MRAIGRSLPSGRKRTSVSASLRLDGQQAREAPERHHLALAAQQVAHRLAAREGRPGPAPGALRSRRGSSASRRSAGVARTTSSRSPVSRHVVHCRSLPFPSRRTRARSARDRGSTRCGCGEKNSASCPARPRSAGQASATAIAANRSARPAAVQARQGVSQASISEPGTEHEERDEGGSAGDKQQEQPPRDEGSAASRASSPATSA